MPLIIAPLNTNLKVVKLLVNMKEKKHLESLGIIINSNISIVQGANGSIICKVKEGRLALDRSIATKIIVTC